jgi:hypothetical protein
MAFKGFKKGDRVKPTAELRLRYPELPNAGTVKHNQQANGHAGLEVPTVGVVWDGRKTVNYWPETEILREEE